jgi:hypothetical protein
MTREELEALVDYTLANPEPGDIGHRRALFMIMLAVDNYVETRVLASLASAGEALAGEEAW